MSTQALQEAEGLGEAIVRPFPLPGTVETVFPPHPAAGGGGLQGCDDLFPGHRRSVVESDLETAAAPGEGREAGLLGGNLEPGGLEKGVDGSRQGAEALPHLSGDGLQILSRGGVGDPLVKGKPLVDALHVVVGDEGGKGQGDLHGVLFGSRLSLELPDRLPEQFGVEIEAEVRDVPRLAVAENAAGSADFQIVQGDLETGPEVGEVADHLDSLPGRPGKAPLSRDKEVGIGPVAGPADPAAELVEVREAEGVGPVDEHRVGVRDVEARFDDGGAQEEVVLSIAEGGDYFLEGPLVHLAVGDGYADFREEALEIGGDAADGPDAVVNEEDLSAPPDFPQHRLADQLGVEGGDGVFHGEAVLRRRGNL